MPISFKLTLSILVVFIASMAANYAVLQVTIKPRFDQIEAETAKLNHKRVLDAIEVSLANLRASVQDWAYWDDAHNYAIGLDAASFIAANLQNPADTLANLGLEVLVFRDAHGRVIWGEAIDRESQLPIDGLVEELSPALAHALQHGEEGAPVPISGLVQTSRGLMLTATAAILKSDRNGMPVGTVVMGALLDVPEVRDLTGVSFALDAPAAEGHPTGALVPHLTTGKDEVLTGSTIIGYGGKPVAALTAHTPRDVSAAGVDAVRSAMMLTMVAAALVMIALWFLVNSVVVSRVIALRDHFTSAGLDGRLRKIGGENTDDEIGQLARTFNELAEQVNHLREVMADNSYLAGMSEWATGTLHNVRNGLSPINVAAWRVMSESEKSWLRNFRTAIEKLQSPETPPELREKYTTYILAKAPFVLELARQSRQAARDIMSASKSVEEMVSGYEKYTHHQIELEEIDLRPLVEITVDATIKEYNGEVEVVFAPGSADGLANPTVVRQIIANLLSNALEAMHGQKHPKIIEIAITPRDEPSPTVEISITDNGEGISLKNIKRVFERGFSTRLHKVGGLGLHWCANAARAIGGTLVAQSRGARNGSTFTLTLPGPASTEQTQREVA